jgi:hypothetical protein
MSAIKNISLFIPHVYANFTSEAVFDIIQAQGFGEVKNVDFVAKTGSDGKPYNAVYIHFYQWYDNIVAHNFQERVLNPNKEARIMYDDPWYWLVLQNKGKKHVPGQRKPTIDLDAFTTPEKPVAPMINFRPLNAPRLQRSKSTYLVGPPPAPLNLQKEFDIEAQSYCGITQEEMDWAYEQMERDNEHLISIDGRYVQSLEQDNAVLRGQMSVLEQECEMLRRVCYRSKYPEHSLESSSLANTIKE